MQKGFTLIELLVVMIIVSLLVVASVPKYKTAMEKARAQEGINNLSLAADQANGYYMMQEGSYANLADFLGRGMDKAHSNYFTEPQVVAAESTDSHVKLQVQRTDKGYNLNIIIEDGQVVGRECQPKTGATEEGTRLCDAIGWGR